MSNFKNGKVLSISRPASTHVELIFESEPPLVFEPGQFISIRVNERDIRSYSLSGVIDKNNYQMIVDVKPGGPGSQFFDNLKVSNTFEFLGPLGRFVYKPEDGSNEIIFLATGTGIAPLKAMIEKAINRGDKRKMTLYFGLRFLDDIFWDDYFNKIQETYDNFKFVLCLSKPDENWKGVSGHITDLLKIEHNDLSQASAYLCGNGKMIGEASVILKQLLMPEDRIYFEKFF